jgi:hypothetical protein
MTPFAFPKKELRKKPFEHVVVTSCLPDDVYRGVESSFPECAPSSGPTGYSYYWGDTEYDRLITENPAWKAFFESAHSQAYIDYAIAQFGPSFKSQGCTIDLSKAKYVPYRETREGKEQRHLTGTGLAPHELFVRLDIHQGHIGYSRKVHLDHRRRLISMLIYFSDSDESGRDGGELVLHSSVLGLMRPEGGRVTPRRNLMAAFACSPVSFHSVPEIKSQSSPRNYVQIQISSSIDAWPK